jgi:multiple sugar transport system substrate-binding protein
MRIPVWTLAAATGWLVAFGSATHAQEVRVFANSAHQIAFQGPPDKPDQNLESVFEKETGLKVVWEAVPYPEMRQSLMRALASSSAQYDVVMVEDSWAAPDLLGKLVSIESVAGKDGMAALNGIFPGMRNAFTLDGDLKGVPIRSNPQIVHYNKQIFADRGISAPKTFEAMLQAAEKASYTREDGAKVYGLALKPSEDLITIVKALGGGVLSSDYKIDVASPATVSAIERIKALYDKGAIPPDFYSMDSTSVQTLMNQGLTAMTFFGDNYYMRFNNPKSSRIAGHAGFFAMPGEKEDSYAPSKVAFWAAALPQNGSEESRKAGWAFIRFLASAPAQLQMALNGNGPVDGNTLHDPQFAEKAPYAADSAIALEHASPLLPVFDGTAQVRDAFQEEAVAAITGKKPAAEAMAEAKSRIEAIVAQKRPK